MKNKASILQAVINFDELNSHIIQLGSKSSNKMNSMGDSLESFIKDLFCSVVGKDISESERDVSYSEAFSYLGNQNNPPDFILKGSDAVEVKKTKKVPNGIQLNSSPPKNKLYVSDPRITKACIDAVHIWGQK